MFLAIAVDNLADAESLTAIEKEEEREHEKKLRSPKVLSDAETEDQQIVEDDRNNDGKYSEKYKSMFSTFENFVKVKIF